MLLKNLDLEGDGGQMLVNGSRGVVTGFATKQVASQQCTLSMVPKMSGWGITYDRVMFVDVLACRKLPLWQASDAGLVCVGGVTGARS